jgi:soluble lytic murein transglycosylase
VSPPRRRSARRRRLAAIWTAAAVIAVVIVVLAALIATGRLVVPGLSGKVYPMKYETLISKVAAKYHVDPYLLEAVARTESGFNPEAESGAGAKGLMQFLPSTAEWVTTLDGWKGPKNPVLTDPEDSLELGACYLSYLFHRFDGRTAAIAGYNAGPNKVSSWVQKAGGEDSFGSSDIPFTETKDFVSRVNHWQTLFKKTHPDAFDDLKTGSYVGALSAGGS